MKRTFFLLHAVLLLSIANAQNVGIGTATPNLNAALEIKTDTKGVLMPRIGKTPRNSMTNVSKGMLVFDTTDARFYYHDGNKWRPITDANPDSLLTANSFLPITANMSINGSTTASNGILYDNGGPSGNYSNNSNDNYFVNSFDNDSAVGYKVVIEQMNLESPFDSLEMYVSSTDKIVIKGTTTGTYYFSSLYPLTFRFRSNATNTQSGFKISWHVLTVGPSVTETPPMYGWYFNARKMAVRGGVQFDHDWDTENLGRSSFAYGHGAKAEGAGGFAFGGSSSASGGSSVALSAGVASGNHSFAMGDQCVASGEYSTAIGYTNQATGDYSVVLGSNNIASEFFSTALGYLNESSGVGAMAMGRENTASGTFATAMGWGSYATNDAAVAMGVSQAHGKFSTAMGYGSITNSFGCTVIGLNNEYINSNPDTYLSFDPVFIVGNGASYDLKSNAMVILKNGKTGIGTNTPQTKLHIMNGTDASLSNTSGYLVLGDVNGTNVVFDNNEILARNNGVDAPLTLQNSGGAFVVGGSASKPGGGSWSATSDARLKQNVKPYSDGLQQLLKINPVYYQYNQQSGYNTQQQYVGVIAQELKKIAPYMVGTFIKNDTEYLNVDNTAMTYMLINAVKEQQQQIEELKAMIKELIKK